MPKIRMTDAWIKSVKVDKRTDFDDEIFDGLEARISPGGVNATKVWNYRYESQADGSRPRLNLGRYPAMSLGKARERALKAAVAVVDGIDPSGAKKADRAMMTVTQLGALFIEKHSKAHKRTWREDERLLKVEVYPKIGKKKITAVTRRDCLDIIEAKFEAGHEAQARLLLAVMRKMFNWAAASDYLATSPCAGIKPLGKAVKRDRVLSADEVRTIWNALPSAGLARQTADIIRLLFLTGQRSGEVCGMMRSEIAVDKALWMLPPARTKNGLAHDVPLSAQAFAIVAAAIGDDDRDEDRPLFSKVEHAIEPNAIAQAVRKKLQLFKEGWTPHDARRTVATLMGDIGIEPHIVESALNHISGFRAGVAGVYNRNKYSVQVRRALDLWAAHLSGIVEGKPSGVVVPMKGKRGK